MFTWGHARQLDMVAGEALARAWAAGAGPGDAPVTIDIDSSICETYGLQKQGGTRFTYTHVRGYHPLFATIAGTGDVVHSRLRAGPAHTARGAASFLAETFARVRTAGATGSLTVRADSGFYSKGVVDACRRAGVAFSVTAKMSKGLRTVIEAIDADAWKPIPYFLEDGADVAETTYRAFGKKNGVTARLIVRRVRPTPGSQLALFVDWSYHAFITDRAGDTVSLEADHRRHAVVENTIRDLKYGVGLNHLPSGRFGANAAWLGLNVMAHNMARWTCRLGATNPEDPDPTVPADTPNSPDDQDPEGAEGLEGLELLIFTDTLRRRFLAVPGRLTRSARTHTLHLPTRWPWADTFNTMLANLRTIILVT
ncbi:MAG: IS1380 family transposase [Actinomycetota bacterium]|nr:IS1380 family transposase [Actinomycetota bacterium]